MYSSGRPNRLYKEDLGDQRGPMNSMIIRALIVGVSFVTGTAVTVSGQTTGRAASPGHAPEAEKALPSAGGASLNDSTRSYDAQALRFESHWGSANILRGANGSVVATVGWFRSF